MLALALCLLSPTADVPDVYLDCLEDLTRYAETTWHDVDQPPGAGCFGDGLSDGNAGIRGNCGMALAYATLARAGRGDESHLVARVEAALRYAAGTHVTGPYACVDGEQWGDGWQTALWTGTMSMAAMLLEDRLPAEVVEECKRVLAHEADRLSEIPPASGYQGDSKAEENAWNSNTPSLAAAWMPRDPRAGRWLRTARRYLANTYTVPDESGPLAPWITTTTLYPSYACENHGFFHPSYQMVSGMSKGDSWLMAHLARPGTAARLAPFARHNVLPVWECLAAVQLDSGELAYPSGLDWSLHGFGQVAYLAYLSTHFGDPVATYSERRLAHWLRGRQRINGDGRFTGEAVRGGFYREAVMARRVSIAWWHHQVARNNPVEVAPPEGLTHLDDVGVIAYRGPRGFMSVSYGERYMALVAPAAAEATTAREAFVCTPRHPNLLGAGMGRATDSRLVELRTDGPAIFDALLESEHGPIAGTRARVVATADALVVIEAPSGVLPEGETAAFPIGIENHAFTGGERTLYTSRGTAEVEAMSGVRLDLAGDWVNVDHRLGLIAGPGGLTYEAPDGYNRAGAAEDTLSLGVADGGSPRFAIMLPAASTDETAATARTVRWEVTDQRAELRFRAPESGWHRLSLELPEAGIEGYRLLPLASINAGTASERHPEPLAIDGDATTFWVSRRGEPLPGHGPTPDRPEWLEAHLPGVAEIARVVVVPRPSYGPRDASLWVADEQVWQGEMTGSPLDITLSEPVRGGSVRLHITSAYDPRHPEAPRNVQVCEIIVLGRDRKGPVN